ncbi:hypothetical protein EMIHUDRAFT_450008 [Emiliania huxleyi CCMP1516]|uniref:Uncharacterized protein n=2 Tax=Emiliania huxleyi TaxID=2903 RepID=A0A0D3JYB5_EMIH1|nr:hypothetical protein EMIHUDRAFT_450008 [Emiliania huxleyi CCMP1516]EOD28500.1 hypothetical protein EMIHUDRAFT_450008 [Emiliania huxleyi CCMP1516]|eukprot:XP_005780929.1 hypothetical protein EMIHUDRAFT_450008 [Emiliania huxleyi CCMP1516]
MASVGLSLSGQPSALAPGPCGSGGAGTARQLDFSTNLLLGGGGADSEDEDLFGAKSRQAAAELGAQHAAARTLPSGSSEVEAASPGLLESGPPASAAPAASAVSQVPSEPPAPNTEQVTTPSPPRARDLAPSAATSVGDVAPRAVDAVPITPPARQEQQRATSSAPLPPRPAAPPDRVLASAPGAMPPPAPRLTPQPVSLGGGAALTRRPLGGQLTSLIGSGAFGPAPTPALSPQLASSRLLAAPARRAGSSPLVHGPLHAAPPEAVPGGERERIGTGAAATSPVQARIGLSPESADGAGISDGAQRLQISPATLKLSKQSREQVPTLNKMKQQLHRFQTQFAQMTNEALLEARSREVWAWDPETEYAMHRLREELLAVKQAEHDADANSDDPMDIDDEAPVHAQLTKELEMRSPSGAAASRMETEAPSPAASCSAASTYSSST